MTLTPFLMFTGQAQEAISFYVATFPDAEVLDLDLWGTQEAGVEGTVKRAHFRIADQTFRCFDSPDIHGFGFTPAVSFFYDCDDEATLNALCHQLSDQGTIHMPPERYPFARRFAWVSDRYGISWQLNVDDL